ncbi:MAG TPA: hypothetical protein VGP72_16710 [Planctomycetota bacterium]|jgi:hypothetical protein
MSKKKKAGRVEAQNELKSLESKWLKDHRVDELSPVPTRVMAAKTAALLEFITSNKLGVDLGMWPLQGAEDLVKMDEHAFKEGLTNLQKVGVLNDRHEFRKQAKATHAPVAADFAAEGGVLTYRCAKSGGLNVADRDEYIAEDQEVTYTEEDIAQSPNLQTAIANEWLVQVETIQN